MQPLKQKILASALACLLLFTAGCGQNSGNMAGEEWSNKSNWRFEGAASDQGYYYLREDSFLCFYDFAAQKSVYLCDKAGCTHLDGDCRSYVKWGSSLGMFYTNGKIYTFEDRPMEGPKLTCRGADGSNYQVLTSLMEGKADGGHIRRGNFKVCGEKLYYLGAVSQNQEDPTSTEENYLCRIDLNTGKEEYLLSLGTDSGEIVAARSGQVLLQLVKKDRVLSIEELEEGIDNTEEYLSSVQTRLLLWDEKTGEITSLLEDNMWDTFGALTAWNHYYYVAQWDEAHETNFIEQIDLNSGEKRVVFEPNDKFANYVSPGKDSLLILLKSDKHWKQYQIPNFTSQHIPISITGVSLLNITKDGYILFRTLEHDGNVESGSSFTVIKSAYSFLSFEDAQAGRENYVDFYIREYESH